MSLPDCISPRVHRLTRTPGPTGGWVPRLTETGWVTLFRVDLLLKYVSHLLHTPTRFMLTPLTPFGAPSRYVLPVPTDPRPTDNGGTYG